MWNVRKVVAGAQEEGTKDMFVVSTQMARDQLSALKKLKILMLPHK
jgi:hypothetical protein